jgi:hypothetical protein
VYCGWVKLWSLGGWGNYLDLIYVCGWTVEFLYLDRVGGWFEFGFGLKG